MAAAALISNVDRQALAVVVGPLKADLKISDGQIGWLSGILPISLALAALPMGALADRGNRKFILAAGVMLWTAAAAASGLSATFGQLLLARVLVGVAEASLIPCAASLIGDYFPPEKVPTASSVIHVGTLLGAACSFLATGAAVEILQTLQPPQMALLRNLHPWQLSLIAIASPGCLVAAAMLLIHEPPRQHLATSPQRPALRMFYRANAMTIGLHHAGFLAWAIVAFSFNFWSVAFLTRVHHLQAPHAAMFLGGALLVGGAAGPMWVARWASRKSQKRSDANLHVPFLAVLAALPLILATQMIPSAPLALAAYVPALMVANALNGLAYGSLIVMTPSSLRAAVSARFMVVMAVGMMAGPVMIGLLNDNVFAGAQGIRLSTITVSILFGAVAAAALAACRTRYGESFYSAADAGSRPSV
jgi:MFS family permease